MAAQISQMAIVVLFLAGELFFFLLAAILYIQGIFFTVMQWIGIIIVMQICCQPEACFVG